MLKRDHILVLVTFAVVAGTYLAVNGAFPMPLLHGDEDGYLNNARRIVDGFPPSLHGYVAGYSLFLVIPALATRDPWLFYELSLDVNALLAGVTAATLVLLARALFPTLSTVKTIVSAGFGVATAGVAVFPLYAMSESVLVPSIAGASLLLALAVQAESMVARGWLLGGFSCVAGFSAWANPRGLALVLAAIVIVGLLARTHASWSTRDVLIVTGVTVMMVLVGNLVNGLIVGDIVAPGTDASRVLGTIKEVSLWPKVLANIVRRLGYLTIASMGLFWVVVVWLFRMRSADRSSSSDHSTLYVTLFLGLALAVSLVLNSMTMGLSIDSRYDQLFYGRYLEIYLPPLIAIAIGLMATSSAKIDPRIVAALSLAVPVVSAVALSFEPERIFAAPVNAVVVYALGPPLGSFIIGGVFLGVTWYWESIRQGVGLILIGTALAGTLVLAHFAALDSFRQWRADQVAIPLALLEIEREGELDCIAVLPIDDLWHQYHQASFFVPRADLEFSAEPDCEVRIGSADQFRADLHSERLAYEPELELFLWRSVDSGA